MFSYYLYALLFKWLTIQYQCTLNKPHYILIEENNVNDNIIKLQQAAATQNVLHN